MPVKAFLTKPTRRWHVIGIAAGVLLLVLGFAAIKLVHAWPFTRSAMLSALETFSARPVKIQQFRMTFFPPGCEVEGIEFEHHRRRDLPPLVTVQKLTIRGSYSGLLGIRKHLAEIVASGGHILVPPKAPDGERPVIFPLTLSKQARFDLDSFVGHDVVVEFRSAEAGKEPYVIKIEQVKVQHIEGKPALSFQASFATSKPVSQVHSQGEFGPWDPKSPGSAHVKGIYRLEKADLGVYGGITGTLGSTGTFNGTLARITVDGTAQVPDFRVTHSSHTVSVTSEVHGTVDARSGDTQLDPIIAHFLKTTVTSRGGILGNEKVPGKNTDLELAVDEGRVEDLLLLFIKAPVAPMTGVVNLRGSAKLPPGSQPFLHKLAMEGNFGIGAAQFKNPKAQQPIDKLSKSSRGESHEQEKVDPRIVLSELRGQVTLKNAIANFGRLTFRADGSDATLTGTFNLISQEVDLHGTLATTGKLSELTSGMKSLLVKIITPFFKKKQGARIVHFKITGTYGNPVVGLDLGGKN